MKRFKLDKIWCVSIMALLAVSLARRDAEAQGSSIQYGTAMPPKVKTIYERGLGYLVKSQNEEGSWSRNRGTGAQSEPGITGMGLMAFMANGEDPNFGKYSVQVRKAVRSIIRSQDASTGYIGNSMYHHGFATLGLAEAYGALDESALWRGQADADQQRGIGEALELAVRCAVTAQKNNNWGGWVYGPTQSGSDSSVSGAVLMGLLAARNAGIEVPDACINKALGFYRQGTSKSGQVVYRAGSGGHGNSMNRSAIATLVYSVGKKKDWDEFQATLGLIRKNLTHDSPGYSFYFRYYMSQALFQADFDSWKKWNRITIERLETLQQPDGSFVGNHGAGYATSMSLLALALNYRFLPIYER